MDGFGLLVGHLIGDYILQNDWMASNKSNAFDPKRQDCMTHERIGHLSCTVHCVLYTLAVWACSFWWMPWWGILVCFLAHWLIDRYRFAAWWMRTVSNQEYFASPDHPMFPWSIVVVDNTFHLLTLALIASASRW